MKVVEGLLQVFSRVFLSEINKVWFLSILGIWDLNNHIWAFRAIFMQILTYNYAMKVVEGEGVFYSSSFWNEKNLIFINFTDLESK